MRIMISGGGSGGHIYPALVVAEELHTQNRSTLYVGSAGGIEETLVTRAGVAFRGIAAGQLRGVAFWQVLYNAVKMLHGIWQAWFIMGEFAPDAVFVTGGYVSVPVILAAGLRRCSVLIYLPDLAPGKAIQYLARFARRVAVSFAETLIYFPSDKAFVSGYPVRAELYVGDKLAARRRLGLSPQGKVLLVFGGSQGAHSINRAIGEIVADLVQYGEVLHIYGKVDGEWLQQVKQKLPASVRERYHLYDYLHDDMPAALLAADLVVARAGAATLGEFPAVGIPTIVVPYPYAGQHQELNADYLAQHGAAVKLLDAELSEKLAKTIEEIWLDEARLAQMRTNMHNLAQPGAARNIVEEIEKWTN